MHKIPIIAFAAYSGTGKTTLVEKIILLLKEKGLRVAIMKHDAHRFEIDHEGKDSYRFAHAGADITIISSGEKTAMVEQRPRSFAENLNLIHDVDLILVEGYKQEDIPKIGLSRKATDKGLPHPAEHYIAIATDDETIRPEEIPVFSLDDAPGITDFILGFIA